MPVSTAVRRMRTLALVGGILALASRRAAACDCVGLAPLSRAIATEADVIVAGTVVEITERSEHRTTMRSGGAETSVRPLDKWAVLAVSRRWRGDRARTIRVHLDGSDCEYPFALDTSYLVFANRSGGALRGSRCSRILPLDAAADVLHVLGPARP